MRFFFHLALKFATASHADSIPDLDAMLFANSLSPDLLRLTLAPIVSNGYRFGMDWTLLSETAFYVIVFLMSLAEKLTCLPHLALANSTWPAHTEGVLRQSHFKPPRGPGCGVNNGFFCSRYSQFEVAQMQE